MLSIWDVKTRRQEASVAVDHAFDPNAFEFSPDGNLLVLTVWERPKKGPPGDDRQARGFAGVSVRDAATGKEVARHRMSVNYSLWFADQGKTLLGGFYEGNQLRVRLCDLATGKVRETIARNFDSGTSVIAVASPDGRLVAVTMPNHRVDLWDIRAGRVLTTLKGNPKAFLGYAAGEFRALGPKPKPLLFSPDGRRLFAVAMFGRRMPNGQVADGSVRVTVWDIEKLIDPPDSQSGQQDHRSTGPEVKSPETKVCAVRVEKVPDRESGG